MMDTSTTLLFLVAMATTTCSVHGIGIHYGSGCTARGQYLVSRSNRCQYIHCTYRSTPFGSGYVGIVRRCPPGTMVPRALYSYSREPRVNHPMAICSQRILSTWHGADCNVHSNDYHHTHHYDHDHSHNMVVFTRPAKRVVQVHRPKVISRVYKPKMTQPIHKQINQTPVKLTSGMLSDVPDYTHYKRTMTYAPIAKSKMAAPIRYENEIDPGVAPSGGYKADYDSTEYFANADAEAEMKQSMRKLLPVDEEEIMSDEEASKMVQEMMALGKYDEDA